MCPGRLLHQDWLQNVWALQALDDDDDSFEKFQKEASQLGAQVTCWPTPPPFALLSLLCLHADNEEPFEGKGCMHQFVRW